MSISSSSRSSSISTSRASGPLSSTLSSRFWNDGVNDEVWVTTMVDVGSGLQMYDDLMIPITDGGDETWVVCGMRLCRAEFDSTILWVVLISWDLRNRFVKSLINC